MNLSTKNMTGRDIPEELRRNAARRRKQVEKDQLHADIIEALLYALCVIGYCLALKHFIK